LRRRTRRLYSKTCGANGVCDLQVTPDTETLRSTVMGCMLDTADDLKGEAESCVGGTAGVRMSAHELTFWLDQLDRLDA
jgi:hypothetical protein